MVDIRETIKDDVDRIEFFYNCELWSKQKDIVRSVYENKVTAVRSCHSSGKSFISARIALDFLLTHPDSKVLTTGPSWTQVKEILWREINSAHDEIEKNKKWKTRGRCMTYKYDIAPDWYAAGLATRKEGDATQVAQRMLGFHARSGDILIVVDEASGIKEPIWGAIEALMTSEGAKLLAIGNPYKISGGFAEMFKQKRVNKIHIQDTDIPNVREGKVVIPGLMSPDYPKEMEEKYGRDSNIYQIKVKGNFPTSETDTLIPVSDVLDAFEREVEPLGEKVLGVDPARFGDNFTTFIVRQGKKVLHHEEHSKEDTQETAGRVLAMMRSWGIKPSNVFIDVVGIGAGVVDTLHHKEGISLNGRVHKSGLGVKGINVGRKAKNEEEFYNVRAEAYWGVRKWIKSASLPEDDKFMQLANLKYKYKSTRKGQLYIESKEDMKKRGLVSPDTADALMLTFVKGGRAKFPRSRKERKDGFKPITAGLLHKEF